LNPPNNKILNLPETRGFGPWKKYFTESSIQHPAKANLLMLRWLIKTFTKPGDTILDPLAGTGSTRIIANLMGRNAILVELEEKFCKWIRQNIQLTEKRGAKGKSIVIQGDARKLSQLLKDKVEAIISSPPYSESVGKRAGGKMSWFPKTDYRCGTDRDLVMYGETTQNIGNLPHGEISAIITSPPYADGYKASSKTREEQAKRVPKEILRKRSDGGEPLSLFTSETNIVAKGFLEGMPKNPSNIGNLPLGKVDAVITSPPYGEAQEGHGIAKRGTTRSVDIGKYSYMPDKFQSEENISRLPYAVDAIDRSKFEVGSSFDFLTNHFNLFS
jgi:DNA modification methylase